MMLYFLLFSNGNFVSNLFRLSKDTYKYHTCPEITLAQEHFVRVGKVMGKMIVVVLS